MATGFPVKANYATGDVLTAANMNDLSGTVNYLQYMPPRNPVLNSAFNVWQRGTSGTASSASAGAGYNADRWQDYSSGNAITVSRQATGDTTNLPNIQYCARVQRNSGQTSTSVIYHTQSIETFNSIPFAGKTVVISFYARAGANYSPTSGNLRCQVATGTGTDQNWLAGFTGVATPIDFTSALTTTWQRFSASATLSSSATEIAIGFLATPTGTAGANDYFEITGVQLELGSSANTYMPNQPTYQAELAACQRYYQVIGGTAYPLVAGYSSAAAAQIRWPQPYPVQMRTTPTITKNGTWATGNCGQPSAVFINNQGFSIEVSGSAAGNCYAYPDSTDDTFTMSAEL